MQKHAKFYLVQLLHLLSVLSFLSPLAKLKAEIRPDQECENWQVEYQSNNIVLQWEKATNYYFQYMPNDTVSKTRLLDKDRVKQIISYDANFNFYPIAKDPKNCISTEMRQTLGCTCLRYSPSPSFLITESLLPQALELAQKTALEEIKKLATDLETKIVQAVNNLPPEHLSHEIVLALKKSLREEIMNEIKTFVKDGNFPEDIGD